MSRADCPDLLLDLARAGDPAVEAGAHVINVSGGQRVPTSEAEDLLAQAIRHDRDRNTLIVAAVASPQWRALATSHFSEDRS